MKHYDERRLASPSVLRPEWLLLSNQPAAMVVGALAREYYAPAIILRYHS
jgi:hypothetical protein